MNGNDLFYGNLNNILETFATDPDFSNREHQIQSMMSESQREAVGEQIVNYGGSIGTLTTPKLEARAPVLLNQDYC
jgi:hypothetical protein